MKIAKIHAYRNDASRVIVYFTDRTYLTVDACEAERLHLKPGMELDATLLPALSEESRRNAARIKAVQITGKRSLSTGELKKKLLERGIAAPDADAAIAWMVELGALNDAEYAAMLVRHYRGRGFGTTRVREELRKRALKKEQIEEALSEPCDQSAEILKFLQQKTRGRMLTPDIKRKLTAALLRRGHGYEEIRAGFSALDVEIEEEAWQEQSE